MGSAKLEEGCWARANLTSACSSAPKRLYLFSHLFPHLHVQGMAATILGAQHSPLCSSKPSISREDVTTAISLAGHKAALGSILPHTNRQPSPHTILSTAKFFLQGHPTVLQLIQLVLNGIHLPIDVFLGDVLICLHLPNHMADTFITTNLQFPGITLRLVNTNGGRGTTPKGGFEIPTLEQRETMVLPSVGSRLDTILPSHSQLLQSLPKHALAGCMCTPMTLGERTELTSAPLNPRGPFTLRLISGKP